MRLRNWGPCRLAALPRLSHCHRRGRTIHAGCPHSIHNCGLVIHILSTIHPQYLSRTRHALRHARWHGPCETKGGMDLSFPVLVVTLCHVGGSKGVVGCWMDCCRCCIGAGLAFHGLWMAGWPCGPPSVDRALVGLWWLLGVFGSVVLMPVCASAHGLEKMFVKPVDLWISTSAY